MPDSAAMRPIYWFDVNLKPAELMLTVHRLFDSHDNLLTEGELVEALRKVTGAEESEDLLVIRNEIFLGLVREEANVPRANFKNRALAHLLRQAVVASCTALDAYLPTLLRFHLPVIIERKRRNFWPADDSVDDYFSDIRFTIKDLARMMDAEDAHLFIANKLLKATQNRYFSNKKGIHVTGTLLGVSRPWDAIAEHLGRDKRELIRNLDRAVTRRNDIVHRADRSQSSPEGDPQEITYAQANLYVHTIKDISHALDELVDRAMSRMEDSR